MIRFHVPGVPAPQGSKRYLGNQGGKPVAKESSERLPAWRADVRAQAIAAMDQARRSEGLKGPLSVALSFYWPRPASHYGTGRNSGVLKRSAPIWADRKPDLDKLTRAVLDALTNVVWGDDSQVVSLAVVKRYEDGAGPGCRINVDELMMEDRT